MKIILGCLLLGSIAFADPMPTGSAQDDAAQNVLSAVSGFQIDCPDSVLERLEEATCGLSTVDVGLMRSLIDLELQGTLEADSAWRRDGENLYQRLYSLGAGKLLINLVEREEGENAILINYFDE